MRVCVRGLRLLREKCLMRVCARVCACVSARAAGVCRGPRGTAAGADAAVLRCGLESGDIPWAWMVMVMAAVPWAFPTWEGCSGTLDAGKWHRSLLAAPLVAPAVRRAAPRPQRSNTCQARARGYRTAPIHMLLGPRRYDPWFSQSMPLCGVNPDWPGMQGPAVEDPTGVRDIPVHMPLPTLHSMARAAPKPSARSRATHWEPHHWSIVYLITLTFISKPQGLQALTKVARKAADVRDGRSATADPAAVGCHQNGWRSMPVAHCEATYERDGAYWQE